MSDLNVDDQWSDDWADEFDTVSQPLVLTRSVSNVIENHLKEVQERSTVDDGFRIYEDNNDTRTWHAEFFSFTHEDAIYADIIKDAESRVGIPMVEIDILFGPDFPYTAPTFVINRPSFIKNAYITSQNSISLESITGDPWSPTTHIEVLLILLRTIIACEFRIAFPIVSVTAPESNGASGALTNSSAISHYTAEPVTMFHEIAALSILPKQQEVLDP